jgi:glycosyltransferase involved in cell wall biosynthesis
MATPLVSVLMTAFNREAFLAASIESVLAQSLGDFELIITDDRSSDATVAVAQEYARRDSRIRVHVNARNLGDYANRNYAASLASGEFLKYHDSDDILYPHCLAVMTACLAAEPRAGFGLSTGSSWPGGPAPMLSTPRMSYQREFLGHGAFNAGPAGALFRTHVFRELGGFDDHGAASDYVFWLRACATYPVVLLPADLFWYRVHSGQSLQSAAGAGAYARVPGHTWRALLSADCPLTAEEREQARRNIAFATAKQTWRSARSGHWRIAYLRLRHAGITPGEWLTYLRRPRRSALAGTPLDARGDYLVPSWFRMPRAGVTSAPPSADT